MAEFEQNIREMLLIGRQTVGTTPLLVKETGQVNTKGDHTIEMDVRLERTFLDYIKDQNLPAWVYSEEIGMIQEHPNPQYLIVFDPLDGSKNYIGGQGHFLPFGSLIAFYKGIQPKLNDVVAAGAIEYTSDKLFLFSNGQTKDESGKVVTLSSWKLDQNTPVYLETYAGGYVFFRPIGQKLFIKNQGALVSGLTYVLANTAAAMGGIAVKSEEVGAIYALIKGAGGFVTDCKRKEIGDLELDHNRKYDVLAGSPAVVDFMSNRLKGS